jgi:phosphatidate phosphatase PAH1
LGTVTGKIINGSTLKKMHLIKKEDFMELSTDLKESWTVSNLMDKFPPICKQDPLEVRVNFIIKHFETTGETIRPEEIPEKMYGGALLVATERKRKLTKEEDISEADDDEKAYEPEKKKAKKANVAPKEEATSSAMPTIQEEA